MIHLKMLHIFENTFFRYRKKAQKSSNNNNNNH
jgi:hypothetical protein